MSRVLFAPKIVAGEPVERFDIVYPLEYRLEYEDSTTGEYVVAKAPDNAELLNCKPVAVS